MIHVNEARALMNRQSYEEKLKEYETKIERYIIQAAKDNKQCVSISLEDEDLLFEKCINDILTTLANNDFEVSFAKINPGKMMIFISW